MIVQALMLQALGPEEMFRLMRITPQPQTRPKANRPTPRPTRLVPAFGAARD